MKDKIVQLVSKEADQHLGMSMTYTLFEFVKEKFDELIDQTCVVNEISICENLASCDIQVSVCMYFGQLGILSLEINLKMFSSIFICFRITFRWDLIH